MENDFLDRLTKQLNATGATPALLAFAVDNVMLLENLAADTLGNIVALLMHGDNEGAQLILDAQMTPDMIIAREHMNADELAADTAKREKFLADLRSFGWAILPTIIKIGAGVASGGMAL
jgi:hypothetical protein